MYLIGVRTVGLAIPLLAVRLLASLNSRDYSAQRPGTSGVESAPTPHSSSVVEDLNEGALVTVGKATKPYTQLTVFMDFECPYCRDLDKSLKVLEAEADSDSLKIIFRSFPKPKHAWAMPAAIAAVCAVEQNQRYYFELSDYFYGHQHDLTESTVYSAARESLAKDTMFDRVRFNRCVESGVGKKVVDADIALGVRSGVMFTPTLFVNEKPIVGNRSLGDLRALLLSASPLQP